MSRQISIMIVAGALVWITKASAAVPDLPLLSVCNNPISQTYTTTNTTAITGDGATLFNIRQYSDGNCSTQDGQSGVVPTTGTIALSGGAFNYCDAGAGAGIPQVVCNAIGGTGIRSFEILSWGTDQGFQLTTGNCIQIGCTVGSYDGGWTLASAQTLAFS